MLLALALHLQYNGLGPAKLFLMRSQLILWTEVDSFPWDTKKQGENPSIAKNKNLDKFFFPWVECTAIQQYLDDAALEANP